MPKQRPNHHAKLNEHCASPSLLAVIILLCLQLSYSLTHEKSHNGPHAYKLPFMLPIAYCYNSAPISSPPRCPDLRREYPLSSGGSECSTSPGDIKRTL
ncbi:hypothetical protein BD779DRAFT_291644 [Infundibulicybe gibba]|nr:hypothetical protein BD779DRAFT_291644 [Infundibulicybe gibba]